MAASIIGSTREFDSPAAAAPSSGRRPGCRPRSSLRRGRFKGKPAKIRRCARNCERRSLPAKSGTCPGPSSVSSAGTSRGAWATLPSRRRSLCDDRFVNRRIHMPALPIDTDQIVITASRAPEPEAQTPASVTIIDPKRIERLDEPLVTALLRLTPSAAVTTSGPRGSLTEIRIRGAEANHTLLFVDGIKIDDPASGDTPRLRDLQRRPCLADRGGPRTAIRALGLRSDRRGDCRQWARRRAGLRSASAEGGSFGFATSQSASGSLVSDKAGRCRARSGSSAPPASTASTATATRTAIATSQAAFAGPGTRRPNDRARRIGDRADRPQRNSTVSIRDVRAHRYARQQPQPAGGGADLGQSRKRLQRRGAGRSRGPLLGSSNTQLPCRRFEQNRTEGGRGTMYRRRSNAASTPGRSLTV